MRTPEARDPWTSLLLLERLRIGDEPAAEAVFARYFDRLIAMARGRLSAGLSRRVDPEDIAMSAYGSFFVQAREGRYVLGRGGDLWRLLSAIALHKLLQTARHERAARRSFEADVPIDHIAEGRIAGGSPGPAPEEALAMADDLEWVFSRLDPCDRRVLELRLRGLRVPEIAEDAGRSERSVRRSFARIRDLMAGRLGEGSRTLPRERSGPLPIDASPEVLSVSHRDFLLRRLIGVGRTGKVYEARPYSGGSDVAVKFLRKPLLGHPEVVRRFLGEARIVAGFRHPNIVETRGLGRTDGGSYFLVMELVDGGSLAARAGGRAVAEADAIDWTMQICDAVEHAHGRGIVHCDLKPANILIDRRGRIRVTDFGLARSLADGEARTAAIEGTAPFMASEQASWAWGPIDHRTDVHGIGAVLFALLTGCPPYVGRRPADILAEVVAPTPVLSPGRLRPDLSGPLVDVCRQCLSKDPEARYQTAREVRSALAAARDDAIPRPRS